MWVRINLTDGEIEDAGTKMTYPKITQLANDRVKNPGLLTCGANH